MSDLDWDDMSLYEKTLELLDWAEDEDGGSVEYSNAVAKAQVYATLALGQAYYEAHNQ